MFVKFDRSLGALRLDNYLNSQALRKLMNYSVFYITCSKFVSRMENVCSLCLEVQSEFDSVSSSSSPLLSSSDSVLESEYEQLPSVPPELSSSDSESSSESIESFPK